MFTTYEELLEAQLDLDAAQALCDLNQNAVELEMVDEFNDLNERGRAYVLGAFNGWLAGER